MKIILVIIIWLNTGVVTSTVKEVDACPPKGPLFAKYEKLKADGALLDWAALCTPVEYKPINRLKTGV
tara:strand:+ start:268 stop:471 length:204 start_codon:yes stop_codon:yes gene_type:complete